MDRWVGKVAVVTGASSGIGLAIAKELAEKGVIVVALARRFDRLQDLAKSVNGKIYPRQCDIEVESDIISTFQWIESTLGGVDIMVNNSGVLHLTSLIDGDTASLRQMLDVNVMGLTICTREALKTMRKRGDDGHIFHINSIHGHRLAHFVGHPLGMYTASKHAITALTESLRVELQEAKSNIKITGISPGGVVTDMVLGDKGDNLKIGDMLIKDFVRPEDISEALIYSLCTKPNVQVHDILIQPLVQTYFHK